MCGLVGAAGNVTVDVKDVFTQLLLVDVVRGHHATGAAMVKRVDDHILMEKAPIPSPIWIGTKQYQDLIGNIGLKVLIGHNRYATVGEKNTANSHPFQFDGLVGAHNGTLENWALKTLDDYKTFGTDSEALYNSIAKNGLKETIGNMGGAWALTWFDKKNNTINLLRNNKRPLYYAYSENRENLFWASEADMLEWIVKRHKIKIFENGIYECEADRHYRWTLPTNATDKFDKPVMTVVEGATFEPYVAPHHFTQNWKSNDYGYGSVGGSYGHAHVSHHVPSRKHVKDVPGKIDTNKFRPPYKDAYGKVLNKQQFEKLVTAGCVYCENATSVWGEYVHCLKDDMDGRKLYLCSECYNDDDTRILIQQAI